MLARPLSRTVSDVPRLDACDFFLGVRKTELKGKLCENAAMVLAVEAELPTRAVRSVAELSLKLMRSFGPLFCFEAEAVLGLTMSRCVDVGSLTPPSSQCDDLQARM